jgi:hypothetical protein
MEFTAEQKLYADIVQKAWEDANFKKALVENPVATIESFTGQKLNLPAGKTLVVRDQTDETTVYINIPAAPEMNAELSEEQLEAVAGGCAVDTSGSMYCDGGFGYGNFNPLKNIKLYNY